MKKSLFTAAGLMSLALAFSSCQKEPVETLPAVSEPNFELFAQPVSTKTTNDGLDTKWADGDAINVFHAAAGSKTYVSDGQFSLKDAGTGKFDGTVTGLDADASYDWYAFYPYVSQIVTPANTSKGWATVGGTSQTQTGNNSMTHLAGEACPLYGIATGVASDETPSIVMKHLASVIKVNVTNNSGEELTVSSVAFTGTEDIVGTYYINFAASPVTYTSSGDNYVSKTATLTVNGGEAIANGSSAAFYMALKPFTAKSGSTLKLSVNGYEKTIELTSDVTFTAGHIKTLGFNFDKKVLDCVTLPWSIDGTGGSSVWKNTVGLSQNGLGSDYAKGNSPYLTKFDTTNDYVQVKYDSPASIVKFSVKMIGGATTSYMTVLGSAGGATFAEIEKFEIGAIQNSELHFTTSNEIDESYRFIRLLFTKGANVGLGAVEITKDSTDPAITADNITDVSARGVSNQTLSYSISNAVEGAVLSVSGDDEVVTAIDVDGEVIYDVAANKTASDREGAITLTYAKDGVTLAEKTVKVQQLAPVFKVARNSVELDAAAGSKTTVTVTSDFDWTAAIASSSTGFTFSPDKYTWQEGGKETVTITASADNASESGTATLGTITFSNIETEEELIVTVTQKSSYVAPTTGVTVTKKISDIVSEKGYKVSSGNTINTIQKSIQIDDNITMSSTGGGNTGSFWGTSPNIDWRCYQSESNSVVKISAKDGYVIETIKLVFTNGNNGTLDGGKVKSGEENSVNSQEISYVIGHSSGTKNGQIRITEVSVTYKEN